MKRVYRAAVIGCGRIGTDTGEDGSSRIACHAAAYRACKRVKLVALCDSDQERLRRAGARWRVARLYGDHRELLAREQFDLLSVCTPSALHARVLGEVLALPRLSGVLVEKPVAVTAEEAGGLVEQAMGGRTVVSVNYIRRFCPAYRKVALDIQSGRLGDPLRVHGLYTRGLLNNGTHALDLFRWWLGEPTEVTPLSVAGNGEDPTSCRLSWADGAVGWLEGLDTDAVHLFEIDVIGTEGRLRFVDQGHRLERSPVLETASGHGFHRLGASPVVEPTGLERAIQDAVVDLIESIERGRAPACTLADGRDALLLAARASQPAAGRLAGVRQW